MSISQPDRIPHPPGDVLMDYVLTPYSPRTDPTGRLHSASLLRHFLRSHGMLADVWPIIERLGEHLGAGQTVWGIKVDAAGNTGIELYFYNHCANAPGSLMSVTALCAVLSDLITIPDQLDESLPYLMCSLELDAARLTARRSEGFRIYLPGTRSEDGHDGISYVVGDRELVRENRYSFFDAATELDGVTRCMETSLHGANDRAVLLHPRFTQCHTICYAEKRLTDALYFSRISTPLLGVFARAYLPGPLAKTITEHAADLAHLCWDVGYDFQRRPTSQSSRIVKAGIYGYV
ncbi:MAG: hypothetical protein ACI8RZ_002271 [Myxococcota bacterium]